ncbi:metallophosphoesterase family protein [Bacillus atrophaeus]|uniref:metallophosphoesterase family protein n=1 Tax=Bacillus atrophaeus TaxID=1452 RepID=UPI003EDB0B1E
MKWLHLSDLHLIYKNYDTDVMRISFFDYLDKHFKGNVDCLFITGDITHQGQEYTEEVYQFLNKIVASLNIAKEKIYMIPGNHDIKRTKLMGTVIKGILSEDDCKKAINEIDEESFDVLYKGQQGYITLYERFLEREYPKDNIHFVIKTEEYNVVHINTCLIAGGDNVEGKILVGLQKLLNAIREISNEKDKVTFALGHHTVNCLNEVEKSSFLNRLSDNEVDFYLCGHVHKSNIHQESNNYKTVHMFTAGANVVDGYSDTIFLEGNLDTNSGSAEVYYHTWNPSQEFWHVNNSLDRRLVEGKYTFELEKVKKKILRSEGIEVNTKSIKPLMPIDRLEFKNFLIDFHSVLSKDEPFSFNEKFELKDVRDKFKNMKCSISLKKQYDNYSVYFPIVHEIFKSSSFVGFEKKHLVPSLISKYYFKVLHKYNNGDEIFVAMTEAIVEKYGDQMDLSEEALEIYISILIYWEIHECDIYNENKKDVS